MSKHIRVRWTTINLRRKNANDRRRAVGLDAVPTLTVARRQLRDVRAREKAQQNTAPAA